VASRPVIRQLQRNKQLYKTVAPLTSMFPRQRENTIIMEDTFSMRSVPRYNEDQLEVAVRELQGFSRCELLLLEAGS
jgi:hypothetical protein